jgi:hypothetical protein
VAGTDSWPKRNARETARLAAGKHPVLAAGVLIDLHPEAAPAADREAPGLRCGTCVFRQIEGHVAHCAVEGRSRATVAAWWPACAGYTAAPPAETALSSTVEEYQHLASCGVPFRRIAEQLGIQPGSLSRALQRAKQPAV